ncbi:hypothetical protein DFJ73DRAFT_806757 [Zopfochytrium polystomum]|nr:hypothetical protein DFJ73DRAFT_806757 [Zopfochytrium polystomum]
MVALSSHRLATVLDALGCRARSNTAATGTANAGPAGKVQTQKKPSKANRQQEGAHRHHEPRPVSPRSEENVSALQQALDWVCSIEDTQPFLAWLQAAFDEGRSWAGDQRDTHEGRTFGFDVLTESESDAYRELSHLGLLPTDDQLAQWTKRNPPPAQEELIQAEIDKLKRLNQPLERLAASLKLSNETLREEMDHNDREVEILNAKLQDVAGTVNGNIASLHAASSKVDAALKTLTVKVDGLTEITKPEKDGPRFFDLLDKRPFWFQCEDEIHSLVREDSLLLEELLTLFEVDTLNMPEDSLYGDLGRSDMIEEVQRLSAA